MAAWASYSNELSDVFNWRLRNPCRAHSSSTPSSMSGMLPAASSSAKGSGDAPGAAGDQPFDNRRGEVVELQKVRALCHVVPCGPREVAARGVELLPSNRTTLAASVRSSLGPLFLPDHLL
jgi:hypothetical protein